MTTTTPSPYNTARSLKASPRVMTVLPPATVTTPLPLKHIAGKSEDQGPHLPPPASSRRVPRPASTGGASVASSRSNASATSSRINIHNSPYGIPLSTRSVTEAPKSGPQHSRSGRSASRAEAPAKVETELPNQGTNTSLTPRSPIPVSPLKADAVHGRVSEPSIDILLIREGLDPSGVAVEAFQPRDDSAMTRSDGSALNETIPDQHSSIVSEPIPRCANPEPVSTNEDEYNTVNKRGVTDASIDLIVTSNKPVERSPSQADHSREVSIPSPIPLMSNLNLSQYSSAFTDSMKGFCSDINSGSGNLGEAVPEDHLLHQNSAESHCSVDVQVTSRVLEGGCPEGSQCLSVSERRSSKRKNVFRSILCCGFMQKNK